jgi:6-phosphogluconolactonase
MVRADPEAVAVAAQGHIERSAERAIEESGQFRIALAGGSSPRTLYQRLAQSEHIDWPRWHVFFGDERAVPPDDEHSNFRMARESLLQHVPIVPANIHRMQGELSPAEAARRYAGELGAQPLDLVLLGMGDDGHTASLFPGDPALDERHERVAASRAPVPPQARITLTFVALSEAHEVLLLVTGASKAERLRQVLAEIDSRTPELPIARVSPRGRFWFYLDRAAASALGDRPC